MESATAPGTAFSIIVTVHIAPENVDEFLKHLKKAFDVITAIPECRFFQVYQSPTDQGLFTWVEDWNCPVKRLFEEEQRKEYFQEYLGKTEPMWIQPREIKFVQRVGPELLFSKIPPTANE